MARTKSDPPLEVTQRQAEVAALYLRGLTQWDIARRLGVNQGTVSRDIRAVQDVWKVRAAAALGQRKAEELAKIDELERVYHAAWERSCSERERRRARRRTSGRAVVEETAKETEGRDGDPRFLEGVRWCIETRLKVMGAFKDVSSNTTVVNVNWDALLAGRAPADLPERRVAQAALPGPAEGGQS